MTPVSSLGSHCGTAPSSVAKTTRCPRSRRWCHGTATSVVSKSRSGSGTSTFISGRVSLCSAGLGLGGLDLAVLRWRVCHQVGEKVLGDVCDLLNGAVERLLVGGRRLREAADLAHVLQCGGADLVVGGGRLEVVERSDVAAHSARVVVSARAKARGSGRSHAPGGSRRCSAPGRSPWCGRA